MAERKMIYLDDAINALKRKKDKEAKGDIGGFYNKIIQNDIDALMKLPSAQPERKKGKWLEWMKWTARSGFTFGSICSECGYITSEVPDRGAKNCPGCNADMRGKQDGNE